MQTKRFFVAGLVQGVGFRNYTLKKARLTGVYGWVRNMADGRVEALATGHPEQLQHFEVYIRRGPESSRVENVIVQNEELAEFNDFQILR